MKIDVTRMVGELSPVPAQPGAASTPPPAHARDAREVPLLRVLSPRRVTLSLSARSARALDRRAPAFPHANAPRRQAAA